MGFSLTLTVFSICLMDAVEDAVLCKLFIYDILLLVTTHDRDMNQRYRKKTMSVRNQKLY